MNAIVLNAIAETKVQFRIQKPQHSETTSKK